MINNKKHNLEKDFAQKSKLKHVFVFLTALLCLTSFTSKSALACCVCCLWNTHIDETYDTYDTIVDAAADGFESLVEFLYAGNSTLWDSAEPHFHTMTQELSVATTSFIAPFGGFFDGQSLQNAITRTQILTAETARNQIPAVSMCQFASLSKSLAATEVLQKETTRAISIQGLKRTSLNAELQSSKSTTHDAKARFAQYSTKYCINTSGTQDFSGRVEGDDCVAATGVRKRNKDVNFVQTLGLPKTISAALYPASYGPAESQSQFEDIIALSKNLYGSSSMSGAARDELIAKTGDISQYNILKRRALQAKRNVAQHSFANYVGLKAATDKADGSELAIKPHIEGLLNAMGVDNSANNKYTDYFAKAEGGITESSPSYWTQMEVLTKTLYQDPRFYANLYDNPANVKRQQAAMKAIELMQERDIHETALRTETLLSLWLDSEIDKHGKDIIQNWTNMTAAKE